MTKLVNQLWGNGSLMQYLKTGVYTYKTPLGQVRFEDPDGKPGCDFFGINHYARCHAASTGRLLGIIHYPVILACFYLLGRSVFWPGFPQAAHGH